VFSDIYGVINSSDEETEIEIVESPTYDVVHLSVDPCGGTKLGEVLVKDGELKESPLKIVLPANEGALFETIYNYNEQIAPTRINISGEPVFFSPIPVDEKRIGKFGVRQERSQDFNGKISSACSSIVSRSHHVIVIMRENNK
jgi:hypothetical protein